MSSSRRKPSMASKHDEKNLLDMLSKCKTKVVALSAFDEHYDAFKNFGPNPAPSHENNQLPVPFTRFYSPGNEKLTDSEVVTKCNEIIDNFKVTDCQVQSLEKKTKEQNACAEWVEHRVGKITASNANACIRTKQDQPAPSLIKKLCDPKPTSLNNPAVKWGNAHENDAYCEYVKIMCRKGGDPATHRSGLAYTDEAVNKFHHKPHVTKSGLHIVKEKPWLGASPDGLVSCECCGEGILEIKCPYKFRDVPITTATIDKSFCLDSDFNITNEDYVMQLHHSMYVLNRSYADFVVWTNIDMVVIRVQRDPSYEFVIPVLDQLWKSTILPRLVTGNTNEKQTETVNQASTREIPSNSNIDDVPTFCKCLTTEEKEAQKGDKKESMVGCDKCDNWFHPSCLGLKRLPRKDTWYCPSCRKRMKKE